MKKYCFLFVCFIVAGNVVCKSLPYCDMHLNQQDDIQRSLSVQFENEINSEIKLSYTGKSGESILSIFVNDSYRYESIPISFHANCHCFY